MSFHPVRATKSAVAILIAMIASTILMPTAPVSAATANLTVNAAGDLVINGTTGYEEVQIFHVGPEIVVQLFSNGHSRISKFSPEQIRRDVVINLRGGGGLVELTQLDIPRHLRLAAGSGDNEVDIVRSNVGGNVTVIDTGGELDMAVGDSTINGRTTVSAGAGLTTFRSENNHWRRNFTLRTAASGSMLGTVVNDVYDGPVRVTAGNSVDDLRFDGGDLEFNATIFIDLRGAADKLHFDGVAALGRTTIRGGSGDDNISIFNTTFASAYLVDMGQGNDTGFMQDVHSFGPPTINGGSGTDDLLGVVRPFGQTLRVIAVEGGYGY